MTQTAKVILHSRTEYAPDFFTMQLRYPKCIHGEAKTHRLMRVADRAYELLQEVGFMDDPNLSRNASSSRAIPVKRLIQDVIDDPYIPIHWGANQKGMQADHECDAPIFPDDCLLLNGLTREEAWLWGRDQMIALARGYEAAGYHKQFVNRLIEPWCHINVVVSGTNWSNFFALRCHKDAQPEMRALAEAMRDAMAASTPQTLKPGEWHLPYVSGSDFKTAADFTYENMIKLSVARCARVSYLTQDGRTPNVAEDLALYDRLIGAVPLHASPAEHQATPDVLTYDSEWLQPNLHGNLHGWVQFRKTLPGECQ